MTSTSPSAEADALVHEAKVYAALSGRFDPKAALPSAKEVDTVTIVAVASELAAACDTNPDEGNDWLLRTAERRYVIETLRKHNKLDDAIANRRKSTIDRESNDLLLVLQDKAPFSREAIAADLKTPPSQERIRRIIVALDRAGPNIESQDLLQTARSTLAAMEREGRREVLRKRGFFGRENEKKALGRWFDKGQVKTPVRAAFLTGLPGIGKSALLEEMVWSIGEKAVTVRLDFDRAGLDVLDLLGLTMELARQLGERLGDVGKTLLEARLAAASQKAGEDKLTTARRSAVPPELGQEIGATVARSGRPVTLVLDTLEVLRARGVEHPKKLFDWIDELVRYGLKPLRIIAAGRGDALDSCPERIGERIDLAGLDDGASALLLDWLKVFPRDREPILRIAGGNPLVLRLAAEVANKYGTKELPSEAIEKEVTAAFLYRFLLSRIEDPVLAKLANPGLVTRRISAGLLREVLAKTLGLDQLSEQDAKVAFDTLAAQHWLVMRDPVDPDFVVHRSDMRLVLLPLLYREEPDLCARIDASAATWFGKRTDPSSQLDAAYHRLQLLRHRKGRPRISEPVANRFDDGMLAELPPNAQQIVLRARGGRTSIYTSGAEPTHGVSDQALAAELTGLLDRQDWAEGQYVVDQAVAAGGFGAKSQAADAVRAFYWRAGKWRDARRLLAERDRLGADDSDVIDLPWSLAAARLEMRAEFTPGRLNPLFDGPLVGRLTSEFARPIASPARHGALAFRIAARFPGFLNGAEDGKDADPVAAAFEQWSSRGGNSARRAIDIARERLASRGASISPSADSNVGQLLAAHTPYVVFVANLATQAGYEWLTDAAIEAASVFAGADALFVPPVSGSIMPNASSPLADVVDLGLFAEWTDALGFVQRDPNLREIGQAAERWRRTIAGWWQYGSPPPDWREGVKIDAVIAARTEAALAVWSVLPPQVDLWRGRGGKHLTLTNLERRLASSLRDARQAETVVGKAERLLRRSVPAAFVPTLAASLEGRSRSVPTKIVPMLAASLEERRITNVGSREARMTDERLEAVRARITPEIEEAIRKAAGDGSLPHPIHEAIGEVTAAAVSEDRTPLESAMDVAALEAIVQRTGRPPLLIRNDEVEMEPLVAPLKGAEPKIIALNRWIPSVGRIEFFNHRMSWGGTGWVVEKKNGAYLIVTNRHVAKLVAQRTATGTGIFLRSPAGPRYGARVDFREEALSPGNDDSRTVAVTDIAYLADDLAADMAVLRVATSPFEITPLELSASEAKNGDLIALIGYPAFDSRNDANDQARYFRDLYDVKRLAPGLVMQALSGATTLTHDATTLGGNSGSPVLSLATGHVVGLHFSGEYGIANTAVGVTTIKKVLSGSATAVAVAGPTEGRADGHHDADEFTDRTGFKTAFLKDGTIETRWPGLPEAIKAGLAKPSDSPTEANEIRYTHFGVKYSATEKLPIMTAVNIDGSKAVRIKRGADQWFTDGRVGLDVQLAAANFKDLEIDRGHMVRREDPNWGDAGTAQKANDDTFHYVNAAAQHSRLNQGKTLWQGLENYILDNSRTHGFCACVFTGPVLGDEDNMIDGARVPEEFWKIVATLDETGNKLRATAYLLSQGQLIRDLMETRSRTEAMEGVVLGEYRTFQIAIADLAEATGYDFSAYTSADPLARDEGVEAANDAPRFVPLDDFTSIQL